MRNTFVLLVLAAVPALGAPTVIPIIKRAGLVKPDSYIIKFKNGLPKDTLLDTLTKGFTQPGSSVTYKYGSALNGVAAKIMSPDLAIVQRLLDIEYIEQDSIVSISYEQGIDELSSVSEKSETPSSSVVKKRRSDPAGAGVTIYGIDTGIYIDHKCFGGRAKWGATFGGYPDADGNGHGTHTAGTAVGEVYGIATAANIVAVKVLSDTGSGALSDVIAGVNYVSEECKNGKMCIATMSLGASDPTASNKALDDAVRNVIAQGVHFTIAAGNDNQDASSTTPARVLEANTIGAVDTSKNNQKASFSNWGRVVDVWAPGVNIKSAWIGNPANVNTISGTSMATPYVAAVLAAAISKHGQKSPQALTKDLVEHARHSVTFGPADWRAFFSSNNLLAQPW